MQNNRVNSRDHLQIKDIVYCLVLLSLLLLLPPVSNAEEIIKVVMLDNPNGPLPSEQAEKVGNFTGKVFINGKFYTGSLEVLRDGNGLYIINNMPLEEYIEGVIVSETQKKWELEALKARAVISRTVATLYRTYNAGGKYHLSSSLPHLLYNGVNKDPLVSSAVKETRDEILTYNGLPIKAFPPFADKGETGLPAEIRAGALEMARDGKNYREILSYYYPGTTINKQPKTVFSSK